MTIFGLKFYVWRGDKGEVREDIWVAVLRAAWGQGWRGEGCLGGSFTCGAGARTARVKIFGWQFYVLTGAEGSTDEAIWVAVFCVARGQGRHG